MTTLTTGKATEFIQFTRASNATVTDSDGKVKWAPHNLLTNSESFDASAWIKGSISSTNPSIVSNAGDAPNGTTTADRVNFGAIDAAGDISTIAQALTLDTATYTGGVWVKSVSAGDVGKTVAIYLNDGTLKGVTLATITTDWQYITTSAALSGGSGRQFHVATVGSDNGGANQAAVSVYLWGAHLYRSDLGGMQANTSAYPMYNPTTPKNLLGYTEDFGTATWVKTNLASTPVLTNIINGPNGLPTADKIVENTATASHYIGQSYSYLNGTPYVYSVYAKASERTWLYINAASALISGGRIAYFDLSTGSLGTVSSGVTATIVSVGDGWYRCSFAFTPTSSVTSTIIVGPTTGNGTTSYTGDGTSGIYLWGAQLSDSASLDTYSPVYGAAVTSAAYYGPRRGFDGATLACKGLLVEEQRTNLFLRSEQFDNLSWIKTEVTVTVDAAVSPAGSGAADLIIPSTNSAAHWIAQDLTLSAVAYTQSIYAKAGGYTWLQVTDSTGFGASKYANVNLSTGQIGSVNSWSSSNVKVDNVGNGWWRISVTETSTGGANSRIIIAVLNADTASRLPSYAGDGTSGVYLWGAQLEAGSFATSYIPTGAATATRSADVASVSTQAFPYSATEGTLVVSGTSASSSLDAKFLSITDGTASGNANCLVSEVIASGKTRFLVRHSGVEQASFVSTATYTPNSVVKIAGAYKQNDFGGTTNGEAIVTDTTGNVPSVSVMEIGFHRFGAPLQWINGHIRQITYIPRRLSNAELQTRTA